MTRAACHRLKVGEALADPGAAARPLRHHRQPVERALRVALLHGVGHMDQPRVEQERLGLAELVEHAVDEAQEDRRIHAHRARRVEQHHQPERLSLRCRFTRLIGTPPWLMFLWMVRRRSSL